MVWINLLVICFSIYAKDLPRFLTKHSSQSLRHITADGKYAYVQKRSGVLGLVSHFTSNDFIIDTASTDFLVKDSISKKRLIIEAISGNHQEFNLMKGRRIWIVDWGKTNAREMGLGLVPRLHLDDEWLSFWDRFKEVIVLKNVLTQKEYQIKLGTKNHQFFTPEVEMLNPDTVIYTDITNKGVSQIIQQNLSSGKKTIIYSANQSATKIEMCVQKNYLAFGEFPFDSVTRNSQIYMIRLAESTNLAGYESIYKSPEADIGNMVCEEDNIFFVKTTKQNKKLNLRNTEAAKLELKTTQLQVLSDLGSVTQLVAMDNRVLIPFRGEFYVLQGASNISEDKLMQPSAPSEELPLEL
jgi:hypothetical protein